MQEELKMGEKELLNSVRKIEGFPVGEVEDIIRLSNSPLYTAYPNPYLKEILKDNVYCEETDSYESQPYLEDEQYGREDAVYNCHSYHTKVPPKAIEKYIEHYTNPGDVVLDVFAGSGMTGVAAQRTKRRAVLADISSIGAFISSNNVSYVDSKDILQKGTEILNKVQKEYGKYYSTLENGQKGEIIYTIWSDVVNCPFCNSVHTFWDAYHNTPKSLVKKEVVCPSCSSNMDINNLDYKLDDNSKRLSVPVEISYVIGKKRYKKKPSLEDLKVIEEIENVEIPYWYPDYLFMFKGKEWGDTWRAGYHSGISKVSDFYTKRNLFVLAAFYNEITRIEDNTLRNKILSVFTSTLPRLNKLNRYMPEHNRHVGPLSGTLYISRLTVEINVFQNFQDKLKQYSNANFINHDVIVSNQSATDLSNIKDNSIDYIFIDPPFGDNLMYSELNFLWESWLKVFTNNKEEAIINNSYKKDLYSYKELMEGSFKELYRVLKPNRWITIEFHNSKAAVWNVIQESLNKAGFIVAQVLTLDKKKGTTKQLTYAGTVKNDLIINAYKPKHFFKHAFLKNMGNNYEIEFIKQHLEHLPKIPNIERTEQMLFSKMVAYYIQHGFQINLNASEFYGILSSSFYERDGYWFTEKEVREYENNKAKLNNAVYNKGSLFIMDEKTAIAWLNQFLEEKKSFSDISNEFMKALMVSEDEIPELRTLLSDNFVSEKDLYRRPENQEMLEIKQKREKKLLKEFEGILNSISNSSKKLKAVRKEAIIVGFTQCYREKRFDDILKVGKKLQQSVIDSSPEIYDYIDIAESKIESF